MAFPPMGVDEGLGISLDNFNDILSPNEKKGRNERANWIINGF